MPTIPTPDVLKAYLVALFKACELDPARARVLFKAHFEKEPLVLTPISEGPDRFYEATGAFFLWTSEVLGKSSCGGRI